MLISYADESGMHDNQEFPYVVLAGYFAVEEQWKIFNHQWSRALRECELDEFHMTDFLLGEKEPYCNWRAEEAWSKLDEFVSIIVKHQLRGFCHQVSWTDYATILSEQIRHRVIKHPYLALFDRAIRRLLDRLHWLPSELHTQKLSMFFERNSLKGKAEARFEVIRNFKRPIF
jgi:hypothetical protein